MSDIEDKGKLDFQFKTYKLSWTAYIRPMIFSSIFCSFAYLLATAELESLRASSGKTLAIIHPFISGTGWAMLGFFILRAFYRLLSLRVVTLYTDEEGVWLRRGVFPWNKGSNGVRWENLDSAWFRGGLLAWICNSYSIAVTHKFTKDSEFYVHSVSRGKNAVAHINDTYKRQTTKRRDEDAIGS